VVRKTKEDDPNAKTSIKNIVGSGESQGKTSYEGEK
jgi:hypothetical protein